MPGVGDGPGFLARATPDGYWRKEIATGADLKGLGHIDPARAWWSNGALTVDADGVALTDADGVRQPLPLPPWGGKLVMVDETGAVRGPSGVGSLTTLFIADEHNHVVVRLPHIGFDVAALEAFASAAGLAFEHPVLPLGQAGKVFVNLDTSPSLQKSIHDEEQRSRSVRGRLRRLVHPNERRPGPDRDSAPAPTSLPVDVARTASGPVIDDAEFGRPAGMARQTEFALHAALAHHADEDLPYLVSLHDGPANRPPRTYASAVAKARARATTDVREVDLRLQAGATAALRARFAEPQLPLPPYNGQNAGFRIRIAVDLPDGMPRLVAAMDEHEASVNHADVAAPPGAPTLPARWADTLRTATSPLRECLLIVAKANWVMPFSDPRLTFVSAFVL